jgi:hypothetical protein
MVVADVGASLKWLPLPECAQFLESELKSHLMDPIRHERGFLLEEFPGEYCYVASVWKDRGGRTAILLEKHH